MTDRTLMPLSFSPGIIRDRTQYGAKGSWYDCNGIRFRQGLPEKIGGWGKQLATAFLGSCRSLNYWTDLSGQAWLGMGTNLKFYVSDGSAFTDVTPIRASSTINNNPFGTTASNAQITVTDTSHGALVGDFVTFSGATGGFAGLVAADLNKEFSIDTIVDANSYKITLSVTPNATTSGGGAAVVAAYQINVSLDTTTLGLGWGTGTWGRDTWGSDYGAVVQTATALGLWSQDNFGEDLVANPRNGAIYYWDATTPTTRMVNISTLGGASDVPTVSTMVLVSAEENHVIALGCNPIGSSDQDPMFVRWSATSSAANWTPAITNTAGGYRLSVGTEIVAVRETRSEIVIWTDAAMYSMRWIGGTYVFSFSLLGANVSVIAPNASATANDFVIWMGREQFYMYDGRIRILECPISDYIFRNLNYSQYQKIYCYTNTSFSEVGWLYPTDTEECDSYVIYNYKDNIWYYGRIVRTAWLDRGSTYYPVATDADGYLYNQEYGFDDGSENPPVAITAYIESGPLESKDEGEGEHFIFIDRFLPDVTFRNSTADEPSVTMTINMQNYPGGSVLQTKPSTVVKSASMDVNEFTEQCWVRLRGRSMTYRCESDGLGVTWRLGVPRISYRLDGRR